MVASRRIPRGVSFAASATFSHTTLSSGVSVLLVQARPRGNLGRRVVRVLKRTRKLRIGTCAPEELPDDLLHERRENETVRLAAADVLAVRWPQGRGRVKKEC